MALILMTMFVGIGSALSYAPPKTPTIVYEKSFVDDADYSFVAMEIASLDFVATDFVNLTNVYVVDKINSDCVMTIAAGFNYKNKISKNHFYTFSGLFQLKLFRRSRDGLMRNQDLLITTKDYTGSINVHDIAWNRAREGISFLPRVS